jgi:hypothetical protein
MTAAVRLKDEVVRFDQIRLDQTGGVKHELLGGISYSISSGGSGDIADYLEPRLISRDRATQSASGELVQALIGRIDALISPVDPRAHSIYPALVALLNQRLMGTPVVIHYEPISATQDAATAEEDLVDRSESPAIIKAFTNALSALAKGNESHHRFYENDDEIDRF